MMENNNDKFKNNDINNQDNLNNDPNDTTYSSKASFESQNDTDKSTENSNKSPDISPFELNRQEMDNLQIQEQSETKSSNEDFVLYQDNEFGNSQIQDDKQSPVKRKKAKPKHSKSKFIIFICAILFASVLLAFGIIIAANDLLGLYKSSEKISVEIPKGASSSQITDILSENKIISFPLLFRVYLSINDEGADFQYGEHVLSPKMGYEELISELKKNAIKKDTVEVTIPEGYNLYQIAQVLEDNKVIKDKKEFVDYFNRNDFGFEFEKQIPKDNLRFSLKEGYAFPDTYSFYIGEDLKSIGNRFLKNFEEKLKPLEEEIKQGMAKYNMTFDEVITLASIIQAESSDTENMKMVAGIFHNRLQNPVSFPKLQSDPTTFYGTKVIKKYATIVDEKMLDAYDTYTCTGLPVGPICSPGIEAIKAAVSPEPSEYFYFVTDKSGKFYFAKTYDQHRKNCRTAGITVPY